MQPPGVVGVGAFGQPGTPEVGGALQVRLCLLHRARASQPLRPGHRAEALLAFAQGVARVHPVALDPHPHVGEQPEHRPHRRQRRGRCARSDSSSSTTLQLRHRRAVVEHRLAHDLHLHLPLHALDHPHQHTVGVVVRRRTRWLEPSSLSCHSPIVSASTTRTHPCGVIQVVSMMFVPGR